MVSEEIETVNDAELLSMKDACQRRINAMFAQEIDPEFILRVIHELEQAREILEPLSRLLRGLSASVTLHAEDPRLKRKFSTSTKNVSKITVNSQRTKWKDVEIKGESMAHALSVAAERFGETDAI